MVLKSQIVLEMKGVEKEYTQGGQGVKVLNSIDLQIKRGQIVALVGHSGSGKSTLLHIAGLLDRPNGGEIYVNGKDCQTLTEEERTQLRRTTMGFVYQYHHLLPEFSALENVMIPQLIALKSKKEAKVKGEEILEQVGLSHRLHHRPAQLSGGEQQRVAICRALANNPGLLLADEPTGNLDPETSHNVFRNLIEQVRSQNLGAIIATHNPELAKRMDYILKLDKGVLSPYN
jgi:lipoprotein-releasing system ATP-binding protein